MRELYKTSGEWGEKIIWSTISGNDCGEHMLISLCNSDKERNGLSLSLGTCGYYAYKGVVQKC